MWVQDVRLPPQPAVPVVTVPHDQMSATMSTHVPTPVYRRPGRGRRPLADLLTAADVDLIHAVTGESIWPGMGAADEALSPFAAQIAHDRRAGRLPAGTEVDARYLLVTGRVVEANGGRNPFSGLQLERALAHLGTSGLGRVDVSC